METTPPLQDAPPTDPPMPRMPPTRPFDETLISRPLRSRNKSRRAGHTTFLLAVLAGSLRGAGQPAMVGKEQVEPEGTMRIVILAIIAGLMAGCQTAQTLEDMGQSVVSTVDHGFQRVVLCVAKRDTMPEFYGC